MTTNLIEQAKETIRDLDNATIRFGSESEDQAKIRRNNAVKKAAALIRQLIAQIEGAKTPPQE